MLRRCAVATSRVTALMAGPAAARSGGLLLRPAVPALPPLLQAASSSSSLAGIERRGTPKLERAADGKLLGLQKGGPVRKSVRGVLAIKNTWNNTLISISKVLRQEQTSPDMVKKTYADTYKQIGFVSGGTVGFKKSKRSSQFSTEKAISEAFAQARAAGVRKVKLMLRGPAISLRKPLFKQLREQVGLRIARLQMHDSVPHGGCRPRKSRRRRWKTRARKQR